MKQYLLFLFISIAGFLTAQQNIETSFVFQDSIRTFKIYIPQKYIDNPTEEVPLLLNLHGLGSNYIEQEFYGDFRPIADVDNFIICHPNGTINSSGSRFWNAGFGSTIDDVGFLSALIDTIIAKYSINEDKVFSTGMSNGGYMSYTLACELPNKIKKIASVTGTMSKLQYANCTNQNPIPVLQIHGTNDPIVSFNGNASSEAIEKVVGFWVNQNNCDSAFIETSIPNINLADSSTATRYVFSSSCSANAAVVFYKIENGGHTWPGAAFSLPGNITNLDFNASEVIWKFFSPESEYTSINSFIKKSEILIFPNPTNSFVQINLKENNELLQIQVYNTNGKLILQENNSKVDISTFIQGIYYLKIFTKMGISNQKIIKL